MIFYWLAGSLYLFFGHGVETFAAETIQTNRTQREFDLPYRIDLPGESVVTNSILSPA